MWNVACRVLVVVFLAQCFANPYFPLKANRKCAHTRIHKLLAADCHDLNLESVPQYLHGDIEILDMSFNRIRELHKKDFAPYSYVKILYLGENFISHIEADTFGDLHYLEVVNMSLNAIHAIPPELFHLQGLRKLTLDHNQLSAEKLQELVTLPSMLSLKFLSLANCKLTDLPPLHKFPHIEFLNVSGNALTTISPSQVASACLLAEIDLSGNDPLFRLPSCHCAAFKHWATQRNISVRPSLDALCSSATSDKGAACNSSLMDPDEAYSACRVTYSAMQSKATWSQVWLLVGIGAAVIFGVIVAVVCTRRCCCKAPPAMAVNDFHAPPANQPEANKNLLAHSDA